MRIKKILSLIFLLLLFSSALYAAEKIKILLKVNNKIITNIDVEDEYRYLLTLNAQLKNINKKDLLQFAKSSVIKEKIKEIELDKYFDLEQRNSEYLDEIVKNFYKKLNFNNLDEFKIYLKNNRLKLDSVEYKLQIETMWNELIYNKYKNQVNINEKKIKEEINNIKKNKKQESYNLSEIVFSLENSDSLDSKFNDLKKAIDEQGFKNVATIYSISDTSKFGGDIGWIDESQLSKEILKEIKSIKIGQITKPISIPGGQLIIKVNEKKIKSLEFDSEGELKKRLVNEKNRQLSQFSSIYFNKIKYNMFINEL
jgi:peptidyl-prolyl cis-trans isomerase SurA